MFRFKASPIIDVVAGSPSRSPPVVLIVEDDPLLRMLAVEVVEEAGFVALKAGNADEAVALLESRPGYFAVLHRHRHTRKHGRAEISPRSTRPLAASKNPYRIGKVRVQPSQLLQTVVLSENLTELL